MQFFQIDKTNPGADAANDFINVAQVPAKQAAMIKNACYDCHSYETKYPWYTYVAPFSYTIGKHIRVGREEVNFSEWASYPEKKKRHKLEEMIEEINKGEMPLEPYVGMHPEANLDETQKQELTSWLKNYMNL
jgi:hypothetical protein